MDGQTSGDDLGQCSFVSVVVLLVIELPCLSWSGSSRDKFLVRHIFLYVYVSVIVHKFSAR